MSPAVMEGLRVRSPGHKVKAVSGTVNGARRSQVRAAIRFSLMTTDNRKRRDGREGRDPPGSAGVSKKDGLRTFLWSAAAEGLRRFTRSPGDAALAPPGGEDWQKHAGRGFPDFSAPRSAKAASPVGLIRRQPPSAAALHKVLGCVHEWTFSIPSRRLRSQGGTWLKFTVAITALTLFSDTPAGNLDVIWSGSLGSI